MLFSQQKGVDYDIIVPTDTDTSEKNAQALLFCRAARCSISNAWQYLCTKKSLQVRLEELAEHFDGFACPGCLLRDGPVTPAPQTKQK